MSTSRTLPTFEPISLQLIASPPSASRSDLEAIYFRDFDPRIPFSWGFTIYRAVFGHGTDTRFAEGLSRLEKWMKWETRNRRYCNEGWVVTRPEDMPAPGEPHISDEIAARLYNEVVEEYPDAQDIITEPEGSEDFSPVAQDFMSRVESFDLDFEAGNLCWCEGRRNNRYDTCLIIDERVLKMLEGLPEDPPEVVFRDDSDPEKKAIRKILGENWLWILNRETAVLIEEGEEGEEGEEVKYPPWIRIRLRSLRRLFFFRARGHVSWSWPRVVEEDKQRWDTVRWWSEMGHMITESRQLGRAGLLFREKMDKSEEETVTKGDDATL